MFLSSEGTSSGSCCCALGTKYLSVCLSFFLSPLSVCLQTHDNNHKNTCITSDILTSLARMGCGWEIGRQLTDNHQLKHNYREV